MASLIESGTYESHLRRVRRLNGERRQTLLNALHQYFADWIIIVERPDAGLQVGVRFADLPQSLEPALTERARLAGIGAHSLASLYDPDVDDAHGPA